MTYLGNEPFENLRVLVLVPGDVDEGLLRLRQHVLLRQKKLFYQYLLTLYSQF